jgi:hypothetical protein
MQMKTKQDRMCRFFDWIDAECMDGEWRNEDEFTAYVMKNMPFEFVHLDEDYLALAISEAFLGYVEVMQEYAMNQDLEEIKEEQQIC